MKEFEYVVKDEQGIHARPAGMLNKCAKELASKITMTKDGKSADVTRLMAVMSLGVKQGQKVTLTVEGETEEQDVKVMETFFEENL